jgi:uncharacterized protein (DUF1015 family)
MTIDASRRTTVVRPFRALHFDPARVRFADVVTPPYDVIDAEQREQLLQASPYNVARVILPERGEEAEAGRLLCEWIDQGLIVQEPEPCLYWLVQDYVGPDGVARSRGGVVAVLRVEPYETGTVRPHERTLTGPKQGRLALMRAVRANVSPIFGIYDDPDHEIAGAIQPAIADREPVLEVRDGVGTVHRLWRVCDEEVAARVIDAFGSRAIVIADGHHRYETALAYRAERRAAEGDPPGEQAYDYAPIYLASSSDPGLAIFPTHRIVLRVEPEVHAGLPAALARRFESEVVPGGVGDLYAELASRSHERRAFGLWLGGGHPGLLLTLRRDGDLDEALPGASDAMRALDVAAVGALVLDELLGLDPEAVAATSRIRYRRDAQSAAEAVAAEPPGTALALLLRPPSIAEVEAVAEAGETMPQKSTYFYPKILDGMVFHHLDRD